MRNMYGISIKPGNFFSAKLWKFSSEKEAYDWVKKEEYDFREREISEDPDYLWDTYADYLPSRNEVESFDDIANNYEKDNVN